MKKITQYLLISSLAPCLAFAGASKSPSSEAAPPIVTQDNFPQAYTSLRFGAILKKTGGVNTFFTMPVPSSIPEEQFVVRMNRDTAYSVSIIDMSGDNVYVTVPPTDKYMTIQIVDENHETQPMIYGPGRHKITAKTDHAFVIARTLEPEIRDGLVIESDSAKPYVVKKYEMESFKAVEKAGNIDFSDGYDQSKAFSNKEPLPQNRWVVCCPFMPLTPENRRFSFKIDPFFPDTRLFPVRFTVCQPLKSIRRRPKTDITGIQ